eukprot:883772_1
MSSNSCASLIKIDELISIFQCNAPAQTANNSHTRPEMKQEHKSNDEQLKCRNLSFMNSTTLVEYTDDYFSKHIPDGRFITGTFDIENDWII